ncbi:MAG TPA: RNA polymerase sigma factor [Bryobacteraceae bacterium]|nr:RNA polymerase sigma factor [Bryobacteraceae bacterium]
MPGPLPEGREEMDEELLRQALSAADGDLRAFELLVQQHQKRIVADCRYMTRDESSAEDLAQEVFVKAFFGLRGFEGRSTFRHWLQRIKVHHCLNHLKKQEGIRRISLDDDIAVQSEQFRVEPSAHKEFEALDDRQRIASVLESLPSTLRIPLIMRDMDELSYEEIASELELGLSAVKMRIKRAREEFRRRYAATTESPGVSANKGHDE